MGLNIYLLRERERRDGEVEVLESRAFTQPTEGEHSQ